MKNKIRQILEKLLCEGRRHSRQVQVAIGTLAVALMLAFVVWPALADERKQEDGEYEETALGDFESEETPDVSPSPTPEPTAGAEPAEKEPAVEEPAATEEPEEATEEPAATETPEMEEPDGPLTDAAEEVKTAPEEDPSGQSDEAGESSGKEEEADDGDEPEESAGPVKRKSVKRKFSARAAVTVDTPVIDKQPEDTVRTYPSDKITLSVTAHAANKTDDILYYQWYQAKSGDSTADATPVTEESYLSADSKYDIEARTDSGTYYYFCRLVSKNYSD